MATFDQESLTECLTLGFTCFDGQRLVLEPRGLEMDLLRNLSSLASSGSQIGSSSNSSSSSSDLQPGRGSDAWAQVRPRPDRS